MTLERVGWTAAVLGAGLILAFLCTTPVEDSDLWYHLAYGRQTIVTGQVVADHSQFSWTPTSPRIIYCAWLAQVTFYALFQLGALDALFILRYGLAFGVLTLWSVSAWRFKAWGHPAAWMALVLGAWTMSAAVALKPQLFSLLLLSVTVSAHLWARDRLVVRPHVLWVWPVIMLVWVNTHGGFVLGLAYQGAALAGEWMNRRVTRAPMDRSRLLPTMIAAVAVSLASVCVTPFGWNYPLQFFSGTLPAEHLAAVRDYDSIFAPEMQAFRYVERGAALCVVCAYGIWVRMRRSGMDWAVLLPSVLFLGLYGTFARLTGFAAAVVVPGVLWLLAESHVSRDARAPMLRRTVAAAVALMVTISALELQASARAVPTGSWRGLGNGYVNPEEEAEYVRTHFPDRRVGNDYNTGGYLLWRLWPQQRVFIDARYFPYIDWFSDYLRFEQGIDPGALLTAYPADVFVVHFGLTTLNGWFRTSPDWHPVFAGRSAVVYARSGTTREAPPVEFTTQAGDIRNLQHGLWLMAFALDHGRRDVADTVVAGLERHPAMVGTSNHVAQARQLLRGLEAAAQRDHANAVSLLAPVASTFQGIAAKTLAESATFRAIDLWQNGQLDEAFRYGLQVQQVLPRAAYARYNVAVMAWWIEQRRPEVRTYAWRTELDTLMQLPTGDAPALASSIKQGRAILAGRRVEKPSLLQPW